MFVETTTLIVMEYVSGGTLTEAVQRGLPDARKPEVFRQLLLAVAYVHAQNIVHRDIKPDNILLTEAGDVKLADFGIAKIVETELRWTFVGTPLFIAPEVLGASVESYGTPVDMWACGIVLHFMLRHATLTRRIFKGYPVSSQSQELYAPYVGLEQRLHWLLAGLLQRRPNARLTAAQALKNEWVAATRENDLRLSVKPPESPCIVATQCVASVGSPAVPVTLPDPRKKPRKPQRHDGLGVVFAHGKRYEV